MATERLTIDVTVARDFTEPSRSGHPDAVALFDLAAPGEVELATAPQGYRLDVEGDLAERLRAAFEDEGVDSAPQLSYPSKATLLPFVPGNTVKGVGDAWNAIVDDWRSHDGKPPGSADRFHVETHVAAGRDVFLTADRSLIATCDRLRDEHSIAIDAMTVATYLERPSSSGGGVTPHD